MARSLNSYVPRLMPNWKNRPVLCLSSNQAQQILDSLRGNNEAATCLDLGLTSGSIELHRNSAIFPDGQKLQIEQIMTIAEDPDIAYSINNNQIEKLMWFDEQTNKFYKLRGTETWPALEISGILMHRIKATDPKSDAQQKVATISPISGRVLDTCFGLGYTATLAADRASEVTTIEYDPNVVALASRNPYSRQCFENPKICLIEGDATEIIQRFENGCFDRIIHDPPTLAVAGDLYGDKFYTELFRVLRAEGVMFHYTGKPGSRHRNVDLPTRVSQRLSAIGFTKVRKRPDALGLIAKKPQQ